MGVVAILVQVLPDPELGIHRVQRINAAIGIGVKRSQAAQAFGGVGHQRVAQELGAVVHAAIEVPVQHQKAIVARYPAGLLLVAQAIPVKADRLVCTFCLGDGQGGDVSVVVQIQPNRHEVPHPFVAGVHIVRVGCDVGGIHRRTQTGLGGPFFFSQARIGVSGGFLHSGGLHFPHRGNGLAV